MPLSSTCELTLSVVVRVVGWIGWIVWRGHKLKGKGEMKGTAVGEMVVVVVVVRGDSVVAA
jgi:hypothetical protein